jgi:hypothetical protein
MKTQPTQQTSLTDKMKIVQTLAVFPAITLMVFIRQKIGFRMLKPSRLIAVAIFIMFIDGLCSTFGHQTGMLFTEFPWVMLGFGFYQRHRRWKELGRGELLHTQSPGISYLERLPLPQFLLEQRRIYRFVEPLLCFIAAMIIGVFISRPLAQWIAFSSFALFIFEQTLYEKALEHELEELDGLITAEVKAKIAEHYSGTQTDQEQLTLEQSAGLPSGVSKDIQKQIQLRRARLAEAPMAETSKTV